MIKICTELKKKIVNQSNRRKRILLKAFKIIKCRRTRCLKILDKRGIEGKGEQLSIIWACEINDTIAGSGPQHSQSSSKAKQIIIDHLL